MQQAPLTGINLALLTVSLSLGIFMNVLDVSIANVAIPAIAGELAVSPNQGTWVITSFAVSQAIMLPLTGWLARRFGEVRLFVFSTLLFSVASFLCGISENLSMLVFFRVVQGAVSGPMIPLSQSLLLSNYPADKKGFATGLWAMTAVVAPICGPILGGWITDNYTWPWIFYINIPIGIIAAFGTKFFLQNRETTIVKSPIDVTGLILLIISVGCLQILLDNGNDMDWFNSNLIVILAVITLIGATFLIAWELMCKHPIIDLSLFSFRNFTIGVIALSAGFSVYFGNVIIFPLWLQTQMGYTPTWAGLAAAPVGLIPIFLTPFVGNYMHKFDLRLIVSLGFFIFAISSYWSSSFNTQATYWVLIAPRILQGLGISLFFTPLISIVLSSLSPDKIASGLGLSNFCRILGGSFGTSLSISLWDRRETFHHSRLVENITNYDSSSLQTLQILNEKGMSNIQSLSVIDHLVTNQAYMLATNDIFLLSSGIFSILFLIVWLAKPPFLNSKTAILAD